MRIIRHVESKVADSVRYRIVKLSSGKYALHIYFPSECNRWGVYHADDIPAKFDRVSDVLMIITQLEEELS